MIPYIMENKKSLKPPTSIVLHVHIIVNWIQCSASRAKLMEHICEAASSWYQVVALQWLKLWLCMANLRCPAKICE